MTREPKTSSSSGNPTPAEPDSEPKEAQAQPISDSDFQQADLEERALLFWRQHGKRIIFGVAAVLLAVVLWQAIVISGRIREEGLRQEYAQAAEAGDAALLEFADAHSGHSLGGAAYLRQAHEAYQEGDFIAAAGYYREAQSGLTGSPLFHSARLGEAMSLVRANDASGPELLETLSTDFGAPGSIRGESIYQLAILAWEAGDYQRVNDLIERAEASADLQVWARQIEGLRSRIPQLQELPSGEGEGGEPDTTPQF